jgi:hypothetical protein
MTTDLRCTHGGRPCPRVIQALPMTPLEPTRRPLWPTFVVAGVVVGIAILEGAVPALVALLP